MIVQLIRQAAILLGIAALPALVSGAIQLTWRHQEPLAADEVLRKMNAAGVHRAVLVPPFLDGNRADLVLAAARLHPDRFAAMGRFDLETPASRKLIPAWRQHPGDTPHRVGVRASSALARLASRLSHAAARHHAATNCPSTSL